jgi:cellulase/cellobiase CelA1
MARPTTARPRRLRHLAFVATAAAALAAGAIATPPASAQADGSTPVPTMTTPGPIGDIAPVANLVVADVTDTSVTLTWDDPPFQNHIKVQRDNVQVAVLPGGSTSYTDVDLQPGTEYRYTVEAIPVEPNTWAFPAGATATTTGDATGGEACMFTWTILGEWDTGFHAHVTVTNHGETSINGWNVAWSWPGDQQISHLWNATWSQSGQSVTAGHVSWNALIMPGGQSFGFGLIASGPAVTPPEFADCSTP